MVTVLQGVAAGSLLYVGFLEVRQGQGGRAESGLWGWMQEEEWNGRWWRVEWKIEGEKG